jgi:hypothetical protein
LAQQQARLLPCAYFMLTFTVPAEFRHFMRSHPRECYQALMQAAYHSLATLAKDSKYLGSDNIGATAVLHTWGRDMNYHPHVHMIVPGGAISPSGTQWLPSRVDYLVPVLALSKIFRAKFKQLMQPRSGNGTGSLTAKQSAMVAIPCGTWLRTCSEWPSEIIASGASSFMPTVLAR